VAQTEHGTLHTEVRGADQLAQQAPARLSYVGRTLDVDCSDRRTGRDGTAKARRQISQGKML